MSHIKNATFNLLNYRFSVDGALYRAKILDIDAAATVRFIDFGNVEVKPLAEMLILPEEFHSPPPFSVKINIAGLEVGKSMVAILLFSRSPVSSDQDLFFTAESNPGCTNFFTVKVATL